MVHDFTEDEREYADEPAEEIADDIDETEGNALAKIRELKEKLKVCEKERKDHLDGWQRSKADYLNSKKRHEEERAAIASWTEDAFIERLLPLCDSFDMAAAQKSADALDAGFKGIHTQLRGILASAGVTEIDAEGKPFDPRIHEALKTETVEDKSLEDVVVGVLQKGYMRKDRLLRPAKVVIGAVKD